MISKVDFWDEVVSEGENQWSYSTKPYSLPSFSKTLCTYCDRGWITDLISQNSLYNLRPETPIFISAQTGSGKTTLIFKECLPLAQKENKRILYLCSRAALAAQVKK